MPTSSRSRTLTYLAAPVQGSIVQSLMCDLSTCDGTSSVDTASQRQTYRSGRSQSLAWQDWLRAQGVEPVFIAKASPQQNCYVERFNGTMRDELLNGETFRTVTECRVVIVGWLDEYNQIRPHRAQGMRTPAAFVAYFESMPTATGVRSK